MTIVAHSSSITNKKRKEERNIVFDLSNEPMETDQLHHSHTFVLVFHVLIFPSNTMRITFSFLVCGGLHKRGTIVFDLGVIGVVECTHTNCGCTSPCTTTTMLWSGKEKREREKGLEEEGKNKEKGVVFVGDFVAHHDGEWIVVVAKW